jgi:hypothetical protein
MTLSEKRICLINRVWGGGEKWQYEFSLRLLNEGYRVFAITKHKSDLYFKFQRTNIPIFQLEINHFSFLNPLKIIQLYRFFKKNGIHIVILGLTRDMRIGGIAAKLAGLNKILFRRGSAIPIRNNLINRLLFKYMLTGVIYAYRSNHQFP